MMSEVTPSKPDLSFASRRMGEESAITVGTPNDFCEDAHRHLELAGEQ